MRTLLIFALILSLSTSCKRWYNDENPFLFEIGQPRDDMKSVAQLYKAEEYLSYTDSEVTIKFKNAHISLDFDGQDRIKGISVWPSASDDYSYITDVFDNFISNKCEVYTDTMIYRNNGSTFGVQGFKRGSMIVAKYMNKIEWRSKEFIAEHYTIQTPDEWDKTINYFNRYYSWVE